MFANAVSWFPQEQAHVFYIVKGCLALLSTVLLLFHMSRTWDLVVTRGQRFRYYSLLSFSVLVTTATLEQLEQDAVVNYRNLGTLLCIVGLLVAVSVSIWDDVARKP